MQQYKRQLSDFKSIALLASYLTQYDVIQ